MSNAIIPQSNKSLEASAIEDALNLLLYSLSETSKRQYRHTFNAWSEFCEAHGLSFMEMHVGNLIAFFEAAGLSHSTRQNRLSHLRKILQSLMAAYPDDGRIKSMYEQSKLLKGQTSAEERHSERSKNTLKPIQVMEVFSIWREKTKINARNRALLAVLLYAGLRRSEAVALKWSDIDFEDETILVRHGKGDKARTVPFLGNDEDKTLSKLLLEWKDASGGDRVFVFCGFRKGDHLAKDAPMKDQAVYEVLHETGDKMGIENLSPHDARRTLLTAALANGVSVADMQFVAGHSRPETTLNYAKVKDAKEVQRRVKSKLPY
jgi:integrase